MIYRYYAIPIKILANYFVDIDTLILKFTWNGEKLKMANTILKKEKVGRLTLSDYKTTEVKTVWCR